MKKHRLNKLIPAGILALSIFAAAGCTQKSYFDSLPQGCDPIEVGRGITQLFIDKDKPERTTKKGMTYVKYTVTSEWANCLEFARGIGDKKMEDALIAMWEPFNDGGEKETFRSHKWHVDYSVFGAVPLQVYCLNSDPRAYKIGMDYADNQWSMPSENPAEHSLTKVPYEKQLEWFSQGYSPQTRLWIDDMYMITFLQLQAYKATGDLKYVERTAKELALYLTNLQQENGLFLHTQDAPYYWGRGNGWMAAGMPMLLKVLPKDNEHYAIIESSYLKMMSTLLNLQREDGLWGQLLDEPESYGETSCTAMFTYAFIEGYAAGVLNEKYAKAARKAWIALCGKLENFELTDVCIGTNGNPNKEFYMNRARKTGNEHGQCAMMWVANALVNNPNL